MHEERDKKQGKRGGGEGVSTAAYKDFGRTLSDASLERGEKDHRGKKHETGMECVTIVYVK